MLGNVFQISFPSLSGLNLEGNNHIDEKFYLKLQK